jgi:hypothetical protein
MNFYQSKLNAIKIALGMDVKMVDAILKDGVTKVMAETLEPGSKIYVVSESGEKAPAPEGTHELEDGTEVYVDAEGTITQVEAPEEESKVEIEVESAEVPEGEKSAEQPTKSEEEVTKEEEKATVDSAAINEIMEKVMMAVEEVAKEIGSMKEEMAAFKSKMEKMSKTPGSSKISTFNHDAPTFEDPIEAKLDGLKTLRAEFNKTKRF